MKKILYVITKSNWGGAQRYVFDLAASLPKSEFEVVVALGGTGVAGAGVGRLAQMLGGHHIRTIFIPELGRDLSLKNDWRAFRALMQIYKTERPDIMHLNSSKVGGIGALAGRFGGVKKIIFTSHGLAYDEDRGIFARAGIWLATWITFLLCAEVIVISKDTYRRARSLLFCRRKIHFIHNGIPALTYMSRTEARAALMAKTDARPAPHTVWIGVLGELTKNKGLRYLIGAARLLHQKEIPFAVFLIGEGEERAEIEASLAEHELAGSVYLVGFLPEGYRYLKAFDVYALTSVKEGLPYVLLEAGQAGLAVVASKIPGNTDIVDENISGLLFESKNTGQLASKLELLIKNAGLRKKLAEHLHAKTQTQFSLGRMVEETTRTYLS